MLVRTILRRDPASLELAAAGRRVELLTSRARRIHPAQVGASSNNTQYLQRHRHKDGWRMMRRPSDEALTTANETAANGNFDFRPPCKPLPRTDV